MTQTSKTLNLILKVSLPCFGIVAAVIIASGLLKLGTEPGPLYVETLSTYLSPISESLERIASHSSR